MTRSRQSCFRYMGGVCISGAVFKQLKATKHTNGKEKRSSTESPSEKSWSVEEPSKLNLKQFELRGKILLNKHTGHYISLVSSKMVLSLLIRIHCIKFNRTN